MLSIIYTNTIILLDPIKNLVLIVGASSEGSDEPRPYASWQSGQSFCYSHLQSMDVDKD